MENKEIQIGDEHLRCPCCGSWIHITKYYIPNTATKEVKLKEKSKVSGGKDE